MTSLSCRNRDSIQSTTMSGEEHFLSPYLSNHLPTIGLDYDTYGPYVTGLVDSDDAKLDSDGFDDVIELLRASSETHADEDFDSVWEDLKIQIENLCLQESNRKEEERSKELEERQRLAAENSNQLSQQAEEAARKEKQTQTSSDRNQARSADDVARRKLLERYAYENEDEDSQGEDEEDEPFLDNRAVAKQAELEKHRKLRKDFEASKKASKEASAKGKVEKSLAKEERKKRASKGERRR